MVEFKIPYKKILSVNTSLMPVKQGNKLRIIKTPSMKKQMNRVREYIRLNYGRVIDSNRSLFNKKTKWIMVWHYNIYNVCRRDLTNLKKQTEDSVIYALNDTLGKGTVDDTQVFYDFSYKSLSLKDKESITISIYSVDELKNPMTLMKVVRKIIKSIGI